MTQHVRLPKTDDWQSLDDVAAGPLLKSFKLRCWSRAYLASVDELPFHDAVDVLQRDAEAQGLVATIGQDAVQTMMAEAFKEFFEP